jgi:hypothetical protein
MCYLLKCLFGTVYSFARTHAFLGYYPTVSQLKLKTAVVIVSITVFLIAACGDSATPPPGIVEATSPAIAATKDTDTKSTDIDSNGANVVAVSLSGNPGSYSVSVTVDSPDIGCESFADWWDVVSEDGELLTPRVLLHSHVDEQPFTRSGGPYNVQPTDILIIRAHMSGAGYGGQVMQGTAAGGFAKADVPLGFAASLETLSPLPSSCAF